MLTFIYLFVSEFCRLFVFEFQSAKSLSVTLCNFYVKSKTNSFFCFLYSLLYQRLATSNIYRIFHFQFLVRYYEHLHLPCPISLFYTRMGDSHLAGKKYWYITLLLKKSIGKYHGGDGNPEEKY